MLDLLDRVQSSRIRGMLSSAVRVLRPQGGPEVTSLLARYEELPPGT